MPGCNFVNCWKTLEENLTTAQLETVIAKVQKEVLTREGVVGVTSSQAPKPGEGSEIIPKGSRAQVSSKREAPCERVKI